MLWRPASRADQSARRIAGRIPNVEAASKATRAPLSQWHVVYLSLAIGVVLWCCTATYYWSHLPQSSAQIPAQAGARDSSATAAQRDSLIAAYAATGLGLQRSSYAINLERAVDTDENVGACTQGATVLEGMAAMDCSRLHCMWSDALQLNVDLWFNALETMDPQLFHEPCQRPRGGQAAPPLGAPPKLAFVITVQNNPKLAAQCLLEVFRTAGEVASAEIIVVDNGSTEDMALVRRAAERLHAFFGTSVGYVVNRGGAAANLQGARVSGAEYVLLLTSDVFVMKGSVFAIMATFAQAPHAGVVGPLFIGADHRMAAAGGIVFNNGDAGSYGRGQHVAHQFNFRRPADYLPAACVAFRRALLLQLGGLDSRYGAAHFAEADLAVAARKAGAQVVFQPLAVVLHQDGGTPAGVGGARKEALMKADRAKFVARWAEELRQQCPMQGGQDMAARRALSPKLLWIDDAVPEPDRDSGSIRTRHMLQILVENGFDVSFQPTASGRQLRYTQQARFAGVDVLPVLPPTAWDIGVDSICRYDVILIARHYVFSPIRTLLPEACPGTPLIYDTVDLHFLREARETLTEARRPSAPWNFSALTKPAVLAWLDSTDPAALDIQKKRDEELLLIDHSRLTIVVSDTEADIIHHYRPLAKVHVISNIHVPLHPPRGPAPPSSCPTRRGVLFVGNLNHPPNRQAIEALLHDILPRARQLLPAPYRDDFTTHVVSSNLQGDAPGLRKLLLETRGVQFHGHLPDALLRMLYYSVKVVAVPLLSGAGVKGKINEAMKYGVPVVATPVAVEAMHVMEGRSCMVARDVDDFVTQLVQVYTNCKLWDTLAAGGRENVAAHFSLEAAYPRVLRAFTDVGAPPLPRAERETCEVQPFA